MTFLNSFLSYGLLMLVTVIVCSAAVFLGITLRKKKDEKALVSEGAGSGEAKKTQS